MRITRGFFHLQIHFLYDVKVMDREKHRNILERTIRSFWKNLEKLSADGARIYIRIPTVKEVNGTDEDMRQIIDYLLEKQNPRRTGQSAPVP